MENAYLGNEFSVREHFLDNEDEQNSTLVRS